MCMAAAASAVLSPLPRCCPLRTTGCHFWWPAPWRVSVVLLRRIETVEMAAEGRHSTPRTPSQTFIQPTSTLSLGTWKTRGGGRVKDSPSTCRCQVRSPSLGCAPAAAPAAAAAARPPLIPGRPPLTSQPTAAHAQRALPPSPACLPAAGAGHAAALAAFEAVVAPAARHFQPNLIIVSAGFDAHWADPLAGGWTSSCRCCAAVALLPVALLSLGCRRIC